MLKRNKIIIIIGIVLAVPLTIATIIGFLLIKDNYKAQPYKGFFDFQTEIISKNNRNYLLISGGCNSSSLKIRKVDDETRNGEVIVKVYTTPFSKNDGSFLYAVELKNSVNRVSFGDDRKIIWERK